MTEEIKLHKTTTTTKEEQQHIQQTIRNTTAEKLQDTTRAGIWLNISLFVIRRLVSISNVHRRRAAFSVVAAIKRSAVTVQLCVRPACRADDHERGNQVNHCGEDWGKMYPRGCKVLLCARSGAACCCVDGFRWFTGGGASIVKQVNGSQVGRRCCGNWLDVQ